MSTTADLVSHAARVHRMMYPRRFLHLWDDVANPLRIDTPLSL
jgi:hypothetical protein